MPSTERVGTSQKALELDSSKSSSNLPPNEP
jgi:hypothetical protein